VTRVAATAVALALLCSGCAASVPVQVAPHAADARCAQVIVGLPDDLAGRARAEVSAQSAAAWGDPPVVLRGGVEPPGPTTDECIGVDGVDWVRSVDAGTGDERYTTYGRAPAVEVRVPASAGIGLDAVLGELSPVVRPREHARPSR
jgi:hypothetical protein